MGVLYISQEKATFTVGRAPESDLVLDHSYVSRKHLIFTRLTDDVASVEVSGTNGAVIREQQVNKGRSRLVRAGDRVTIGNIRMVWIGRRNTADQMFFALSAPAVLEKQSVEIEGPPPRQVPEKPSLMLAAGPALTMAIPILLGAGRSVAVLASVFAAVWAVANVLTRVRRQRANEARRRNTYLSYISECEKEIRQKIKKITVTLNEINPPIDAYLQPGRASLPWKVLSGDQDNLPVRTGMGTIENPLEIVIPRERFAGIDDSLKEFPGMIRSKYEMIPACPVLVDLNDLSFAGFAISCETDRKRLAAFILNLCAAYSPESLGIDLLTDKEVMRYYMWITWLPHYGRGKDAAQTVVFTDDASIARDAAGAGNKAIFIFDPNCCGPPGHINVINRDPDKRDIRFDTTEQELCYSYAANMSRLWKRDAKKEEIPSRVLFGRLIDDMLPSGFFEEGVKEAIERLSGEVMKQYSICDTTDKICAPIGIREGGEKVYLDLHERGSGPHGLIAGTTGSGKSELLTTMIISFSLRYPPEKLSFFLIDYKGGGMSGLFADLPHLLGSISNLTRSRSQRAMTALRSENIRRQELFVKYKVNNINDYTLLYDRGEAEESLPHIVIMVDEFAELKREEPEFMDNLISISQVGRSLGMHLLLATQKPAGVVDEKIRSNTGFRIALRLVDRSDSMDMLHRDDAVAIRECGRGFFQAANEQLVCFQSGYAMAGVETDEDPPRIYTDFFMDEHIPDISGGRIKSAPAGGMTWYEYSLMAVKEADRIRGRTPAAKLFLPPVPEDPEDDTAYAIYDDPCRQRYIRQVYDPSEAGHTLIAGRSQSGKSELLYTMIARIRAQASIYIIDYGGGRLKDAAKWSCCGGYTTDEGGDNTVRLTGFIDEMLSDGRKKGADRQTVVLVLDNIEEIKKAFPAAAEHIRHILTVGKREGIYILAATLSVTGSKEERLFDTCLFLGNDDPYVISAFLRVPSRAVPAVADCPGRGIGLIDKKALEFQAVKTGEKPYRPANEAKARAYPYVPPDPTIDDLIKRALSEMPPKAGDAVELLPAGYEKTSGKIYAIPLKSVRCVLVGGKAYKGRHTFVNTISAMAGKYGITCTEADTYESYISYCRRSAAPAVITADIQNILDDFHSQTRSPAEEDELISYIENPTDEGDRGIPIKLTVALIDEGIRNRYFGTRIYDALTRRPYVLMFGGHLDESRIFDFSYLSFSDQQKSQKRGNATVIKYGENVFSGEVILPGPGNVDNSQTL